MDKRLFLIWITCLVLTNAFSLEYQISAEYITMQEGLTNNEIKFILKDQQGFIWFGTPDGLNRYDGFVVKHFYPSSGALHTTALYQCSEGYIWIGTNDGLYVFNPVSESFILHYKPSIGDFSTASTLNISDITGSIEKGILLTTPLGLAEVNFKNKRLNANNASTQWKLRDISSRSNISLTCIEHEKENSYWLGTNSNLVLRYNRSTDKVESFPLTKINPEAPTFIITHIAFDKNKIIISTIGHGIHLLNPDTGQEEILKHSNAKNSPLSHMDVYGLTQDSKGEYWIATWDGLDRLSTLTNSGAIDHYNWDHPDFSDKLENRIISLLYDPSGVLWLGTHGGGAVKVNLKKQFFKRIKFNSLYEVNDFAVDMDENLYLAIYHGGIKKTTSPFAPEQAMIFEQFSTKQTNKNRQIPTDIVISSVADEQGNIWFGTLESTLLRYDPIKDRTTQIKISPLDNPKWKGRVNTMYIDSKQRFWLGTSNGLLLYDRKLDEFHLSQTNNKKKQQLSGNYIRAIIEDVKGNIWLGTDNGLNKLIYHESNTFKFNQFNDQHTSPHVLGDKSIWALNEMPDGRIWIGYRGGLGYYDPAIGLIRYLTNHNGLCNNFVTCLDHQDEQYLWVGTNSGISRLNTSNLSFSNYYIANNLRAVHKTKSGYLIWGNNKGILYFHPDSIHKHEFAPPTRITNIIVKNKQLKAGEKIDNRIILSDAAPFTSSIDLYYPINSFAIDYVGLSYLNQHANHYEYRLINYKNTWTKVDGSQRNVAYNNLTAGEYIFEVRAANSDGIWAQRPTKLAIIIHPPWYATWWGQILILLIIITLFLSIYRLRLNQIYREQQLKSEGKKLQYKLSIAKIEQEKEHEVAEMKTRFFTNISHELRTPLTLIIAPLKEILANNALPNTLTSQIKMVQENAAQLYTLITHLLDFGKTEAGNMPFNPSSGNVVQLVNHIIKSFVPYAQSKKVRLDLLVEQPTIYLSYDKEKLNSILSNLISNALKYSPQDRTVTIEISTSDKQCHISVKDNGSGIDKEEQKHVFNRFYQSKNSAQPGTGIGLSLARELVLMHKGNITIDSEPGLGTKFTVTLPMEEKKQAADESKTELTSFLPQTGTEDTSNSKDSTPANTKNMPSILIVEDHDQLRDYLASLLSDRYTIHKASNGEEALSIIDKASPVLVISDVMMPVMDGIELCKSIKTHKTHCHIPVILLTAKSNEKDVLAGLETGADEYINKPFTPDILRLKIENLISSREQIKSYYSQKITLAPSNIVIEDKEEEFIRTAIKFVEDNLTNPQFNTAMLAEELNMSQPTLYRRIKTFTGDNISVFIRSIRLKRAAQLLTSGQYAVSEVSEKIGFSDIAYFRRCFIKQFGVAPSKYGKEDV